MDQHLVLFFLLAVVSGVVYGKSPFFRKADLFEQGRRNVEEKPSIDPLGHLERRVIGGNMAAPGAWPWMVALVTLEGYFVCGASLVTPIWLVSAAHCFPKELTDNYQLVANFGATNLSANDELEKIAIRDIILNPGYVPTYTNDIAMLSLARPANVLLTGIDTIKVPNNDLLATLNPACFIIGWGATSASHVYVVSEQLTELRVNIISNAECQERWSRAWTRPKIHTYDICVDDNQGTVSACYGDSGSPLQCFSSIYNAWVLLGVSSWGAGSCTVYPSVYTRTVYYGDWMQEVIDTRPLLQQIKDGKEPMPAGGQAVYPTWRNNASLPNNAALNDRKSTR